MRDVVIKIVKTVTEDIPERFSGHGGGDKPTAGGVILCIIVAVILFCIGLGWYSIESRPGGSLDRSSPARFYR